MTAAADISAENRLQPKRLQDSDLGWPVLVAVIGALTLARLVALWLSPSDLGFDEAQYWAWSRDPAFGYFTKPPLIAWAIWLETHACGDSAACVRAASPLMHFATALVLAALARRLYGPAAGFWTGIFYAIMPGVSVSSFLMTTDVFLMFFWSLALTFLIRHIERPGYGTAIAFALATGIGLYAKYAMIYLPVLALVAAIVLAPVRRAIFRMESLLAAVLIAAIIAPNLWWNASHSFATFGHTGENIGWSLSRLNAVDGFEFFGSQFGVAGPIIFGAMLNALFLGARTDKPDTDRLLMWLSWPVLAAITLQGFLSHANPNWGATAYPSGIILATALIIRHPGRLFFVSNVIIGVVVAIGALLATALVDPRTASGPARQFRQLGGWTETAANLSKVVEEADANRIVMRGRALTAGMLHALRDEPVEVRAYLPAKSAPHDQFQLDRPWSEGDPTGRTLLFGFDDKTAKRLGAAPLATIGAPITEAQDGKLTVYAFPPD